MCPNGTSTSCSRRGERRTTAPPRRSHQLLRGRPSNALRQLWLDWTEGYVPEITTEKVDISARGAERAPQSYENSLRTSRGEHPSRRYRRAPYHWPVRIDVGSSAATIATCASSQEVVRVPKRNMCIDSYSSRPEVGAGSSVFRDIPAVPHRSPTAPRHVPADVYKRSGTGQVPGSTTHGIRRSRGAATRPRSSDGRRGAGEVVSAISGVYELRSRQGAAYQDAGRLDGKFVIFRRTPRNTLDSVSA